MALPTVLTVLTVLRVGFARDALSLMIRVPARPSRPKVISIPSARRGVCARRSRPASARGDWDVSSLEGRAATRNRSEAFPLHMVRSAIMSRIRAATASPPTDLRHRTCDLAGDEGFTPNWTLVHEMVDTFSVERRRTTLDAVDNIS